MCVARVDSGSSQCVNTCLPHTARIQALATASKTRFHLPDGPAQQERDAQMASDAADWSLKQSAWIYGHDAGVV